MKRQSIKLFSFLVGFIYSIVLFVNPVLAEGGESVATVAEETAHSELDLPDEGDPTEDMIDVESEDGTEPGDIAESIDTMLRLIIQK